LYVVNSDYILLKNDPKATNEGAYGHSWRYDGREEEKVQPSRGGLQCLREAVLGAVGTGHRVCTQPGVCVLCVHGLHRLSLVRPQFSSSAARHMTRGVCYTVNMYKEEKKIPIRYKQIWQMVWPSVRPRRIYLFLFLLFAIVLATCAVAEPYLYGSIVDSITSSVGANISVSSAFSLIIPILLFWGGLVLFETSFGALYMFLSWMFSNWVMGDFLQRWFAQLIRLDMELFKSERSGELLRKFDNIWDSIWNVTFHGSRTFVEAGMRFLFALGFGLYLDWRLAIVSLVPIPISIIIGLTQLKVASRQHQAVGHYWDKISGHVADVIANIATIKSFSGEYRAIKTMAKLYAISCVHQFRVNRIWASVEAGYGAVYISGRLLLFAIGSWFVLSGQTTLGTLIMFLGFANFLFGSVQMIMSTLPNISKSLVYLDRSLDIWQKTPDIRDKENARVLKNIRGQIMFENVSFGYKEGISVLKNISFNIPDGKVFALVGESGAGKSTLAQMMLRFYDPSRGSIKIDGIDLRDYTISSLRENVGFVMQENLLFHDSIINNIRLGKTSVARNKVISAAKRAQAHEFISKLPKGYDSVVGERGVKLSGGEKQRIALARVLLDNPPILVLDEATSALDSKTEHALQVALKEVMKGRTTLVIAHRLSTVMDADQILVIDKGRIIAQGTHNELITTCDLYREYWTIQAGGYV